MKDLKFSSVNEALQHLADFTGKTIRIASDKDVKYKGILSEEGKKIEGLRSGKWLLGEVTEDGYVNSLTWDEFKKSPAPFEASDYAKEQFIKSLLNQEKQFNKKVDFNSFVRKNPSFEEKVDWLLKNTSAKYTKRGIKSASVKIASKEDIAFIYDIAKGKNVDIAADAIANIVFGSKADDNPFSEGFYKLRYTDSKEKCNKAYELADKYLFAIEETLMKAINEKDEDYLLDVMKDLQSQIEDVLK